MLSIMKLDVYCMKGKFSALINIVLRVFVCVCVQKVPHCDNDDDDDDHDNISQ